MTPAVRRGLPLPPESAYECGKYHIRSASVEYRQLSNAAGAMTAPSSV